MKIVWEVVEVATPRVRAFVAEIEEGLRSNLCFLSVPVTEEINEKEQLAEIKQLYGEDVYLENGQMKLRDQVCALLRGENLIEAIPVKFPPVGEFTTSVWKRLMEIPYGTTTTYGQIAKDLGRPQAARAVGTACGRNCMMIVVPCHRVIGSNGNWSNFRWGKEAKRQLLEREGIIF